MFLSWIVILGVMWLLGIEFNIVTIILSAFIFGIGDDFSIFIMDGLLGDYRDKAKVLGQHKTAIFFSAFTIVAGMGALIFAKHPAMQSLGLVSLIGIIVVVLMALIIQPFIFRVFISSQTTKGGFPYTVSGLLYSIFAFGLFAIGCMLIRLVIIFSRLPIGSSCRRRAFVHRFTSAISHYFLKVMPKNRVVTINDSGETFAKPAVVIANHQSFVDILLLFGLHRKFVMVTNGWVWNSPFFGRIVRYLGFYNSTGGFEPLAVSLREKIEQGYSVIVFPEGTRSSDCVIGRFHKGAFLLAQQLMLDIVPIIVYGNGLVSSKRQPLYIKKGLLVAKVLPRIPFDSDEYGSGYRERSKNIAQYMRSQYQVLYNEFNRTSNPYFKNAIIYNYIYKGPVLEWYMRIKLRLERWYDDYDRLLPRKGHIVDLGCGYGAMSYMLMMLSSDRRITAVDYDKDKIQLASNCFLKNDRIDFVASDIRDYSIPPADAYVISDVLHYLDHQMQYRVIRQCISNLNDGGVLIIRDGDSSVEEKHNRTMLTEKWSTRIMKFNKTDGPLCFLSRNMIAGIAEAEGMDLQCLKNGGSTSNTMFILTKK
jgi:1-acyl-sn-glycerol-3-phosphate acyltransferase